MRTMRDYLELTKPRVTWLILMSTGVGYFFGLRGGWDVLVLLHTVLGTALIASGTFTLNQWYEREADSKMRRTQARPLPAGRITPRKAFAFGVILSIAGSLELWLGANWLTSVLGLFTLLSYIGAYTPLKQRSRHSTTIGAIPGAMPPLIGYAASAGTLTLEAWILFAILFFWQFPHFYSIAWLYREDYARAGIQMLPVVEPDGQSTARQILITSVLLIPISMLPSLLSMAGKLYLAGAFALGVVFFYSGLRVALERTRVRARGVLIASVLYLPALYSLMLLDRPSL
ncbi:MAG: protoheme IX farnesyltransferase [Bryobacteraceae bacterium]|nr:heme o synthase [Bryobacterales bacterium]NUN00685.1 protoheme IX farnesyltransferase [Bryobacteraceae bacterium]